jgi:hypothetical protein
LDAALRARFPVAGVRTPATQARGLQARMNQLEKHFQREGDRRGAAGVRAAKEAGISPRTWQKWRAGSQKPGPKLLAKLEAAYKKNVQFPKLRRKVNAAGAPNNVKVTAEINWNGYRNRTAYRSTTLAGMRATMVATIRAWANQGPEAAAAAFEEGAAQVHNVDYILFAGDDVEIEFPYE